MPCKSKDYFLNGFSVKTIVLVGIYNQQFQGTIILMVFDFQGMVNKWVISPTYKWRILPGYNPLIRSPLILTSSPGHPSTGSRVEVYSLQASKNHPYLENSCLHRKRLKSAKFFPVTQTWVFYSWPFQGLSDLHLGYQKVTTGRSWLKKNNET